MEYPKYWRTAPHAQRGSHTPITTGEAHAESARNKTMLRLKWIACVRKKGVLVLPTGPHSLTLKYLFDQIFPSRRQPSLPHEVEWYLARL